MRSTATGWSTRSPRSAARSPIQSPSRTPIRNPIPTRPAGELAATGYKVRGLQKADLSWTGAPVNSTVTILRSDNGGAFSQAGTATSDSGGSGAYTDPIDLRGSGSYTYRLCAADGDSCSNEATINF